MGSDQSSSRDRDRENRERAYRESATARDVERALERQREVYEKQMKDILLQKKCESATAAQRQSSASSTPIQPTVTDIERQRAPYNYNQVNQANLGATGYSSPQGPNFASGYSTLSPGHTVTSRPGFDGVVYADNCNPSPQQAPQVAQPTQSYLSSTTPVPASTSAISQSHQGEQEDDDIKCSTYGQRFGEQIFQCDHGHSSCASCHIKQVLCYCGDPITTRRNYDLEKYRKVKCPHSDDGCSLTLKMSNVEIHAKECPFKGMQCPSLGSQCTWSGKPSQLSDHFEDMHPAHCQGEVDKEMLLVNITDASHTMHYIRLGPINFLFHLIVSGNRRINMAVQLIGTKLSASKWIYEIHVFNKGDVHRKYQHVDRCSSYNEPIQEIVNSARCAVIPLEYAKTYLCGEVLTYKFFIKKTVEKAKDLKDQNTTEQNNSPKARKGSELSWRKEKKNSNTVLEFNQS